MGRRRSSRRHGRRVLKTRRLLLVVVALLVAGGSAYGIHRVQVQRQATGLLEVARAARAERDWSKAADFYRQYTNYRSTDAEGASESADVLKELVFANQRRWTVAATAYERVLNLDPDRNADRKNAAVYYLRFGRYGAARKHLETLVKSEDPAYRNDPELYVMLARCDAAERNPAGVAGNLQKAVATGKAQAATYTELATLRRNSGSPLEADHLMNELVAARPKDLEARLARARDRVRSGNRSGAIDDLRVAYNDIPGGKANVEIVLQQAELTAEGDRDAALKIVEAGLAHHPDNPPLKLARAEILNRMGSRAESAILLKETAAKLPDGDPHLLTIGDRLLEQGEPEAAFALAKKLESVPTGSLPAKYLFGRIAAKRGDWPGAIPALEASIPAVQSRYDLLFKARSALAGAFAAAGDPQRREENLAAASAIQPQNAAVNLERAGVLVQLGRVPEAMEIYRALSRSHAAARSEIALMKFREILALPDEARNWAEFEALLGPLEELDPALETAYAQSLLGQNQPVAAEKFLASAMERNPKRIESWIAMAELVALTDLDAAWGILDAAERTVGDAVDIRLMRSYLMALTGANAPTLLKLAEPAASPPAAEAARLERGIASLLASLGHLPEALDLLLKANARQPYDLTGRYSLFDSALRAGAVRYADAAYEEIRKLDGDSGPVATAAGFARELARSGWPTPDRLAAWKPRIEAALQRRANWGRLQSLAGDLASLENRHADALRHYLKAIELNDTSPAALRRVAELLMEQQRYPELAATFGKTAVRLNLTPDLQRQFELARAAAGLDPAEKALAKVRQPSVALSQRFREQLARAGVFLRYGQQAEALDALRFAKALNDASPQVRVAIVRLLVQAGELDAARREVAEAEKRLRDPRLKFENPAEVPASLGLCKQLVGDSAGAIAEYTMAAEAKPGDLQGWQRLLTAYAKAGRTPEAEALLVKLAESPEAEVAKWAKGQRANAVVASTVAKMRLGPASIMRWW
jgi:tetratricopeptide (TPR) repeat protein